MSSNAQDTFTPSFFRRLQQLKIRTRRSFLGSRQGAHRSIRKGHGLEFADYRQYVPGDDFRHIDWGVYGRTDRVYVREFREEQDLNVSVILDASASMAHPKEERKFELAREIGLALGYVALTNGDTVTFSALGHSNTPRYSGPRALHRAQSALYNITPEGSFDMLTEVRAAVARQQTPGKCFFISDFLLPIEEQIKTLDFLRSRNFEVSVIQILAPSELHLSIENAQMVIDAESGEELELALDASSKKEYAIALAEHVEKLERYCGRGGMSHLLLSSDEHVADIVLTKLPELGILK